MTYKDRILTCLVKQKMNLGAQKYNFIIFFLTIHYVFISLRFGRRTYFLRDLDHEITQGSFYQSEEQYTTFSAVFELNKKIKRFCKKLTLKFKRDNILVAFLIKM